MPNNTYDRYVTWAMGVLEGVAVPRLDRWSLPVMFPDPDLPGADGDPATPEEIT